MAMVDLTRLTRSRALALFAALSRLTVFAALVWPVAAEAGTAIHFTLDRKIDGPAAPFFLAIDKGYFKAEGLDVTIDAATGGPLEAIDRLATGVYEMGVADINFLIKYRDSNPGTPIKALFVVFDKPPYAIIARKSRGIVAPKDLAGKRLGAPSADPAFAAWPIFAKVNGIDAAKVVIENVGLPVREPMLAAGEVDAITGCSFTAYVDLKDRGVPPDDLVVLLMADDGVELYGDAIMASPKFAQEKPEAARAFLRAYVKALKDTVRDPARAVESVLRRNDTAKKDTELERLRMAIRDNIVTRAVKANGYGSVDPERFEAALDQLALIYHFKAKDKAAAAFDPSFLPPAAERRVSETASR
ncbi:MAG: ABC transporter substrate-binding protein [Xanthobacteraceae bacterium]|jgi:NitT/TauT family transport system substrate-binding protein